MNEDHDGTQPRMGESALLERALELYGRLNALAAQFSLGTAPKSLLDAAARAANSQYLVAVVGEAKRGKSTFLNALIGRRLLPESARVATCQPFFIENQSAEHPDSYSITLEDGSTRSILEKDLSVWGSQDVIDSMEDGKVIRDSAIIKEIHIRCHGRFLPPSVVLVDTPGLDSLHPLHKAKTISVARRADAAILVLDSEKTILEQELQIVGDLLSVTPEIFFVQTKIDLTEQWRDIVQESQATLIERFSNRLRYPRLHPVSSENAINAFSTDRTENEELMRASRLPATLDALHVFLDMVTHWRRAAGLLSEIAPYWQHGMDELRGRLSRAQYDGSDASRRERDRLKVERATFCEKWSEGQPGKPEALRRIQEKTKLHSESFRRYLAQNGPLATLLKAKVNATESRDELKQVCQVLGEEAGTSAGQELQACLDRCAKDCQAILIELDKEFTAPRTASSADSFTTTASFRPLGEYDAWTTFKGAVWEKFAAAGLVSTIAVVFPILAPLVPIVGILALVFGFPRVLARQLNGAQGEARRFVDEKLVEQIRSFYWDPSSLEGRDARATECFKRIEETAKEHISAAFSQKIETYDRLISVLSSEIELEGQNRATNASQLQEWTTEWQSEKTTIESLHRDLENYRT